MKVLLTTLNAKYIHKNLAIRWLYVAGNKENTSIKEYTTKEDIDFIVDDILSMDVDVVAFSTYIWNIENTMKIVKALRELDDKQVELSESLYDGMD